MAVRQWPLGSSCACPDTGVAHCNVERVPWQVFICVTVLIVMVLIVMVLIVMVLIVMVLM